MAAKKRGGVKDYVSEYAKVNHREDFAECIKKFVLDRETLKYTNPAREKFLTELFTRLWKSHKAP